MLEFLINISNAGKSGAIIFSCFLMCDFDVITNPLK